MKVLEEGIRLVEERGGLAHPGILHMYIHAMEMSPRPEQALRAADALRNLVPDSGHLRHMPSHIYVLCGLYYNALDRQTILPLPRIENSWPLAAPPTSTPPRGVMIII